MKFLLYPLGLIVFLGFFVFLTWLEDKYLFGDRVIDHEKKEITKKPKKFKKNETSSPKKSVRKTRNKKPKITKKHKNENSLYAKKSQNSKTITTIH